jgi:PilZ domain
MGSMLMSRNRDYYRILHVAPDAPTAVIHASYSTLLQRIRSGAAFLDSEQAALLDEAYSVLGDQRRRADYDAEHERAPQPSMDPTATAVLEDPTSETAVLNVCRFCAAPHGMQRAIEPEDDCGQCGSPLFPAERHRLEYSGQRMLSRIPKQRAIELYVAWPQPQAFAGQMRDLSLNGMQFTAATRLHANQIIKIDCLELRALGRVAHSTLESESPERWSTGVEFLTLRFRRSRGSFVSEHV